MGEYVGARVPEDEPARLAELHHLAILDTPPEDAFEDMVRAAAAIAGTPTALVSLVDDDRQWFKAAIGATKRESSRDQSFCAHAILNPREVLVVPDTLADPRFATNPAVTRDDGVRFYAGAPLVTESGRALGTLCVLDTQPSDLTPSQREALRALASQVVKEISMRRQLTELSATLTGRRRAASPEALQEIVDRAPAALFLKDTQGRYLLVNHQFEEHAGRGQEEVIGRTDSELWPPALAESLAAHDAEVLERLEPQEYEEVVRDGDGSQRTYLTRKFPLLDWSGAPYAVCGIATDITVRKAESERLARSEAVKAAILRGAYDGVVTLDRDDLVLDLNVAAERLLGVDASAVGRDAAEIGLDPRFLAQQDGRRMEIELERDGGTLVFEASMTTLVVEGDRMRCAFLHDITERRTFERRLRHLADHDALTGLLNRARFICEVELESARLRRYDGRAAVLVLDIDNFKHLNDSLGHKAGDEYLVSLAGALRTRLRESDHLCRLGGDEFAVLMPTTDADGARRTADSLVEIIRHHAPVLGGRPVRLSASVGGVVFGAEPVTPEELLAAADVAMYAAKEAGRDRSTVVEGSDIQGEPAGSRLTWAERIRGALAEDRLVLHAQPIVDLATGAVDRLELLLRMVDDGGELLLPGAFLGTAERFDLVQAIDRWVTTRAIELLDGHDFSLAINVSGRSIGDPELLATVERGLRDRSIAPGRLVFEITETAAIANIATAREFADRLRALGCRLALDDFGTGFGSFYYLKHMPADDVKIDGDFVRDMAASPVDQEVVRAVVAVAGALGPRTIAECVEDEATHALVREYGVDLGQGWHYGRPAPVADVIATLR